MTPLPVNTQPAEGPVSGDGSVVELQGEPFLTVQGEGTFAGFPAVFIRVAGCNLQCQTCDTDYTSARRTWKVEAVVEQVKQLNAPPAFAADRRLAVVTGGEPFRQPIGKLVRELLLSDYTVQIETNGTLYQDDLPWLNDGLFVVCAPKAGKVHDKLRPHVTAYKYPLRAGFVDEADGLPLLVLGGVCRPARPHNGVLTYVLPEDDQDPERNAANLKAAVKSSTKFGYVFQKQVHKEIGLP